MWSSTSIVLRSSYRSGGCRKKGTIHCMVCVCVCVYVRGVCVLGVCVCVCVCGAVLPPS